MALGLCIIAFERTVPGKDIRACTTERLSFPECPPFPADVAAH
jgi:hypothetical protein